ncbi:MAG: hypothetical protein N3F05_04485 [Candidatus Diapherotrites archaeon]|nr:hypothetical protein [Candidatus Diapherotrites archaeon]
MSQRGIHLMVLIFVALFVLLLLPPIIMAIFKPADLLIRILLTIMIFATVRNMLGSNALTIVISSVLVYILVIKYAPITASLYIFFFVLLAYNFIAAVMWGLTRLPR